MPTEHPVTLTVLKLVDNLRKSFLSFEGPTCLFIMEEIRRRPFRVCNFQAGQVRTIGMVAASLQDLKRTAVTMFGLRPTTCQMFLLDGTEVKDEEYFALIVEQTLLMVVFDSVERAGSQSKFLEELLI